MVFYFDIKEYSEDFLRFWASKDARVVQTKRCATIGNLNRSRTRWPNST